jgi:nitroimidazol reductase NimA-like FMN-containing flavoprotein (pyridoxamine 5'-phosphate oxidase superfamily)
MKLEAYQSYLEETVIPLRLACRTGSGWPLILSLWYLYQDGSIYCATQASARIVTHLKNDPRCAFEIASDQPPYCGIRGQAEAEILPRLGGSTLAQLLIRYLGDTTNTLATRLLRKRASEVAIRLRPISVYSWNFTDRMQDAVPDLNEKPCP